MSKGWIKLHRKIQNSDMYKNLNSVQRDVMINCLLLANHKSNKWEWQGEIFECDPGQFITSLSSLKEKCAKDVSTQNIRTAIDKLEKWDFLTNKSTKTGRLITICNWSKYQADENETNKATNNQLTKHQQSTNKALTTNKNVKNVNNDKEHIYSEVIDYLNQKADKQFKPDSKATVKKINGRLDEGYELEDFKHVIDVKTAEWKDDPEMNKYLRPQTLFAPTKFEGYLNEKVKKQDRNYGSEVVGL